MKFSININSILFAISFILILNQSVIVVVGQTSKLEKLLPTYRVLRNFLFDFIGRTDTDWAYRWNFKRKKVQKPYPESQQFLCDPNGPGRRSAKVPSSVNKLTPGDIDIIGAIGDSLTAGNGAFATNILQVLIENKGVSWSIGGQGTWHKYLTIPNILKVFNPKLYGYSLSDGFSTHKTSRFNVAEIGAMSRDINHEAKILIQRMKADPNVNLKEHWKFITILIGPNDFCYDICNHENPLNTIKLHHHDLIETLRTIRDSLPRTLVNIVTPPNLKILLGLRGKPLECVTGHRVECPCLINDKYRYKQNLLINVMAQWQNVSMTVPLMEEFNNRKDFATVTQPFLLNVALPSLPNGNHDYTYMSLDCFHFSQKGYALASNAYWNNLLQPVGSKSTNWKKEFAEFNCPTNDHPFIYTNRNS